MIRVGEDGLSEEPFFTVLFSNDLWKEFKKYMFPNKKSSNIDDYRDGDAAAKHGYLSLIKNNSLLVFSNRSLVLAAENNHLNVIKFLYINYHKLSNFKVGCIPESLFEATCKGHLDIVEFIFENIQQEDRFCIRCNKGRKYKYDGDQSFCIREVLYASIGEGYIPIIDYFFNKGIINFSYEAIEDIIDKEDLTTLKYVHERVPIKFTTSMMNVAVNNGYLHIIEFLFDNGIKTCDIDALEQAAEDGALDVIKFAHKNNMVEYDENIIRKAVVYGNLEVVKYLVENKLGKCREHLLNIACAEGHIQIVKYLVIEVFPNISLKHPLHRAFKYQQLEVINYFYENNKDELMEFIGDNNVLLSMLQGIINTD